MRSPGQAGVRDGEGGGPPAGFAEFPAHRGSRGGTAARGRAPRAGDRPRRRRLQLRYRPRTPTEEQNAALSLAANMAVAELFRRPDRAVPGDAGGRRARHCGACATPRTPSASSGRAIATRCASSSARFRTTTRERPPSCSPSAAPAVAPATRRTTTGVVPWHAAVAATYATRRRPCAGSRPLRDGGRRGHGPTARPYRTTVEAACRAAGRRRWRRGERAARPTPPTGRRSTWPKPSVLDGWRRVSCSDAVVTDTDDRGARIQITDPAISSLPGRRPSRRSRRSSGASGGFVGR